MQTTHDAEEPATMPHDSPLPRIQSLGNVEGSLTLNELTDAEIAKQLQEAIAKADSAHDIDWNAPGVLRYHVLQNRSFFVAKEVMKKSGFDLQQKQFAKEVSEKKDDNSSKPVGGKKEATAKYEKEKEELRLSLKIIHNDGSEVNYEPLSKKLPIVSWEYQLMGKMEAKDMEDLILVVTTARRVSTAKEINIKKEVD
uniref:Uncharacterized protein n=1 Tax=Tanacetum cinerariifolium TaxID=118510 RepID=A0A6L2LBY5_TANCI|nr:hypothetical protein [Tanacetum cinerariifolium]